MHVVSTQNSNINAMDYDIRIKKKIETGIREFFSLFLVSTGTDAIKTHILKTRISMCSDFKNIFNKILLSSKKQRICRFLVTQLNLENHF